MSSCTICGKGFGFFNKELGCPKCNKVFCKKCLCYKIPASDNPKKQILVCLRCSKIHENPEIEKKKAVKPKLEELLEIKPDEHTNPILEPSTSTAYNEIRNRLDEMKDNREMSAAEDQNIDDIELRLANLKGIDYKKPTNKIIFTNDTRTEQEKIDDLLKQFGEEHEINEQCSDDKSQADQPGSIDDIERRLAILRGQDINKIKSQMPEYVEESEQEEIDRTILKYLDEAKLPDLDITVEQEFIDSIPKGDKKDMEELPFCEICNEDAVIRCLECENIFCHKCFLEFHDEEEYRTHKTKPYQAPNESNQ